MRHYRQKTAEEQYKANMQNLKAIRNCLKKSWMWKECLKNIENMISNFTFEEFVNEWLWEASHKYSCSWLCGMWTFNKPFKIKWRRWLDRVKTAVENKENFRDWSYERRYDKSIDVELWKNWDLRGWYSREYHGCWNGYYYMLLDWDTAVYLEKD